MGEHCEWAEGSGNQVGEMRTEGLARGLSKVVRAEVVEYRGAEILVELNLVEYKRERLPFPSHLNL